MNSLINGNLDRLARFGKIIHDFAEPLLLALFVAAYFGWVPSPMLDKLEAIQRLLVSHDRQAVDVIGQRTQETRMLAEALVRLADILKMIDCSEIADGRLRERCLAR